MHTEAYEAVATMRDAAGIGAGAGCVALDLGGADINGTARAHFPGATWFGLDAEPGPGVDFVADACTWQPDRTYDLVLCTELLEHVEEWQKCVLTAWWALRRGGHLILTCASDGRRPHGARGEMDPAPGEWYANVPPGPIEVLLDQVFAVSAVHYNPIPGDVYAWARRIS
jgi:SAM-dependent methyltransferase